MLNSMKIEITSGISLELDNTSTNMDNQKTQYPITSSDSTSESLPLNITLDMLRRKVREIIMMNRSKREAIESKFYEYDASNPTNLNPKYYEEYWFFLNKL